MSSNAKTAPRRAVTVKRVVLLVAFAAPGIGAVSFAAPQPDADPSVDLERRYIDLAVEAGRLEALREQVQAAKEPALLEKIAPSVSAPSPGANREELAVAEAELEALRARLARALAPPKQNETAKTAAAHGDDQTSAEEQGLPVVVKQPPAPLPEVLPPTASPAKLAELELRLGHAQAARAIFRMSPYARSTSPRGLFLQAQALERTGAFEQAAKRYAELASSYDDTALGIHAAWCERYARWRAELAAQEQPLAGWEAFERAKELERAGRLREALEIYRRLARGEDVSELLKRHARWSARFVAEQATPQSVATSNSATESGGSQEK